MDDLRPDVDDVRRYQEQRGKTTKSAKKQNAEATKGSQTKAKTNPSKKGEAGPPPVKGASGSTFSVLLSLLVLCLAAAGGYVGWHQHLKIQQLEENLAFATDYMNQSKLLMARLEGRVYEADSEIEATDSEFGEKIKFLDSEMRKLWGVAGDINKKQISNNKKSVKKALEEISTVSKKVNTVDKTSKNMQSAVSKLSKKANSNEKSLASMKTDIKTLVSSGETLQARVQDGLADVLTLRHQLDELSTGIDGKILALSADLDKTADSAKPLETRLKTTESAIESIDATRRQVNQRIVEIERKLNEIQLAVTQMQSARNRSIP